MKRNNSRRGPAPMTPTEVAEFLRNMPTGALCIEEDGQLIALPAHVLGASDYVWNVSLSDCGYTGLAESTPACLVAESFTTYSSVCGFIVQGTATRTPVVGAEDETVVRVRPSRVRTFSFGAVSD